MEVREGPGGATSIELLQKGAEDHIRGPVTSPSCTGAGNCSPMRGYVSGAEILLPLRRGGEFKRRATNLPSDHLLRRYVFRMEENNSILDRINWIKFFRS